MKYFNPILSVMFILAVAFAPIIAQEEEEATDQEGTITEEEAVQEEAAVEEEAVQEEAAVEEEAVQEEAAVEEEAVQEEAAVEEEAVVEEEAAVEAVEEAVEEEVEMATEEEVVTKGGFRPTFCIGPRLGLEMRREGNTNERVDSIRR